MKSLFLALLLPMLSATSFASAELKAAMIQCVNARDSYGNTNVNLDALDGTNKVYPSIRCEGDVAKALYEALDPYVHSRTCHESSYRETDGSLDKIRSFGDNPHFASNCRRNQDISDVPKFFFSCDITLDVLPEFVQDL